MTKVSTRPQTGATAETKRQNAIDARKPAVPGPLWHEPTVRALDKLSKLINAAAAIDADRADRNEAVRLIDIACHVIHGRVWLDDSCSPDKRQDTVADYAFDVGALIKGALHVPEQPLSLQSRALLAHAAAIVDALADVHMSDPTDETVVPKLLEAIEVQPRAASPNPQTRTARHIATDDPLHGHTPKQAAIAFGRIATMCESTRMLAHADGIANEYALGILIESIGALADQIIGGEIVGTHADWAIGHNFREAGKTVQA